MVAISAIYSVVPTTPKGYGMIFIYSIELSKKKAEALWTPLVFANSIITFLGVIFK
jgi:hypothetical protein